MPVEPKKLRSTLKNADVMARLGFRSDLILLIRLKKLEGFITECYAEIAMLNDLLDAWEAANPEQAQAMPWFPAREAWKADGRPQCTWYEAIKVKNGGDLLSQTVASRDILLILHPSMRPEYRKAWGIWKRKGNELKG